MRLSWLRASPMISKLRSTNWRRRRSAMYSARVAFTVISATNEDASSMSSSNFGDFGCIVDHSASLIREASEPFVPQRTNHDQIDLASQQGRQRFLQMKVASQPVANFVVRRVLNEEVDVAALG